MLRLCRSIPLRTSPHARPDRCVPRVPRDSCRPLRRPPPRRLEWSTPLLLVQPRLSSVSGQRDHRPRPLEASARTRPHRSPPKAAAPEPRWEHVVAKRRENARHLSGVEPPRARQGYLRWDERAHAQWWRPPTGVASSVRGNLSSLWGLSWPALPPCLGRARCASPRRGPLFFPRGPRSS